MGNQAGQVGPNEGEKAVGFFRRGHSPWPFFAVLFLGAVGGALLGEGLRNVAPFLAQYRTAGFQISDLNLAGLLRLNLGFSVQISLGAVIGGLVGALLGRRL